MLLDRMMILLQQQPSSKTFLTQPFRGSNPGMKEDSGGGGDLKSDATEAEARAAVVTENDHPASNGSAPSSRLQPAAAASSADGRSVDAAPADGGDGRNGGEGDDGNDDSDDWMVQRDAEKHLGDASFRAGDFGSAAAHYSSALSLDPAHLVLLSNRSAAYLKLGEKSRALHDAQECVRISEDERRRKQSGSGGGGKGGAVFLKGYSRLAAALQSLGRYQAARDNWTVVLRDDPNNAAAREGVKACQEQLDAAAAAAAQARDDGDAAEEPASATAEPAGSANQEPGGGGDDLDDFFNDVEEAAGEVIKERQQLAAASEEQQATNAIKNNRKDLGTAESQIGRILASNHKWKNLNPFYVLDVPHTATKDDISRRYKALSLLLHPDKNPNHDRAQAAYDEVLRAKAALDDEAKYSHARQLVEQGMKQGKADWERRRHQRVGAPSSSAAAAPAAPLSLEECQSRAVQRIFAEIEHSRRQVEERERSHEQRERQREEEELERQRSERKFDKSWKQEERVEKRIGNWRDFSKPKKPKP